MDHCLFRLISVHGDWTWIVYGGSGSENGVAKEGNVRQWPCTPPSKCCRMYYVLIGYWCIGTVWYIDILRALSCYIVMHLIYFVVSLDASKHTATGHGSVLKLMYWLHYYWCNAIHQLWCIVEALVSSLNISMGGSGRRGNRSAWVWPSRRITTGSIK